MTTKRKISSPQCRCAMLPSLTKTTKNLYLFSPSQDTSPLEKGDNLLEDHTTDLQVIDLYAGLGRLVVRASNSDSTGP